MSFISAIIFIIIESGLGSVPRDAAKHKIKKDSGSNRSVLNYNILAMILEFAVFING